MRNKRCCCGIRSSKRTSGTFGEPNGNNNVITLCLVDASTTKGKRACSQRQHQDELTTNASKRANLLPSLMKIHHQDNHHHLVVVTRITECESPSRGFNNNDNNNSKMTPLNDSWGELHQRRTLQLFRSSITTRPSPSMSLMNLWLDDVLPVKSIEDHLDGIN